MTLSRNVGGESWIDVLEHRVRRGFEIPAVSKGTSAHEAVELQLSKFMRWPERELKVIPGRLSLEEMFRCELHGDASAGLGLAWTSSNMSSTLDLIDVTVGVNRLHKRDAHVAEALMSLMNAAALVTSCAGFGTPLTLAHLFIEEWLYSEVPAGWEQMDADTLQAFILKQTSLCLDEYEDDDAPVGLLCGAAEVIDSLAPGLPRQVWTGTKPSVLSVARLRRCGFPQHVAREVHQAMRYVADEGIARYCRHFPRAEYEVTTPNLVLPAVTLCVPESLHTGFVDAIDQVGRSHMETRSDSIAMQALLIPDEQGSQSETDGLHFMAGFLNLMHSADIVMSALLEYR